jgi:hypothetical protein
VDPVVLQYLLCFHRISRVKPTHSSLHATTDKLSRHAYTLPCLMGGHGGSYDAVDTIDVQAPCWVTPAKDLYPVVHVVQAHGVHQGPHRWQDIMMECHSCQWGPRGWWCRGVAINCLARTSPSSSTARAAAVMPGGRAPGRAGHAGSVLTGSRGGPWYNFKFSTTSLRPASEDHDGRQHFQHRLPRRRVFWSKRPSR